MHNRWTLFSVCLLLLLALPASLLAQEATEEATETTDDIITTRSTAPDANALTTETLLSGLRRPLYVTHAGDQSGRLFVLLQGGRIIAYDDGDTTLFLDVSELVSPAANGPTYTEQGLLGMAFHPDYEVNGVFVINYTDTDGDTVVARYTVSDDDPNRANPASAEILFTHEQPYPNHNGGHMVYGADGYLYIGLGDGGSGGDPLEAGQDTSTLLGTILRVEVGAEGAYTIPDDNPFVGDANAQDEIWAYGVRNPWRFSFDRATDDFYMGDVGQNRYEEVNYRAAGEGAGVNYGWDVYEATHQFEQGSAPDAVMPFAEYSHDMGCSVTGGYIYRGEAIPELEATYLYGDYCSGNVWAAYRDENSAWQTDIFMQMDAQIASFGEDEAGELYIVDYAGRLLKLVPAS